VVHDFGGIWGLQWAAKHRQSLIGAVMIDGGVLIDYIPHPLAVVWATPTAGELQMATTTRASWRANMRATNPPSMPDSFIDRQYDDYDRASRCAILRYYRSSSQTFMTLGRDQAAALRPLNLPALVVWGRQDPYIPPDQAEKQKQAFPRARIEYLDGSGHWPQIDDPKRVRELVVPFLRPSLSATLGRIGTRSVEVRVNVTGVLPAQGVVATLGDAATNPVAVSGKRTLTIRLRRRLAAGSHTVTVRAYGLPARRLKLRAAAPRRTASEHRGQRDPEDR
jgi:hypothetical protein